MANWIAKATANSHGQFKAKAKKAGMSTKAFAHKEAGKSGKTGRQARLAETLMGMHHKGEHKESKEGRAKRLDKWARGR